jgi:hypothetical protein
LFGVFRLRARRLFWQRPGSAQWWCFGGKEAEQEQRAEASGGCRCVSVLRIVQETPCPAGLQLQKVEPGQRDRTEVVSLRLSNGALFDQCGQSFEVTT